MTSSGPDILALAKIHIQPCDTDSVTPAYFKFCHKPRLHGISSGVGFHIRSELEYKIFNFPSYKIFDSGPQWCTGNTLASYL